MSKIYVMDYGLKSCTVTHPQINALLEQNNWKCTGFNTTFWKDVDGECNVKNKEKELRELIKSKVHDCTFSLLIMCVEKSDVIGTKDNTMIFGCDFKHPDTNNLD